MPTLPRNEIVTFKLTAVERCDLRRAARKAQSESAFIRDAIQRAIAEQQKAGDAR